MAAAISAASFAFMPNGFSTNKCLPVFAAASASSRWRSVSLKIITVETCGSDQISSSRATFTTCEA